ncbi:hypothetical protein BBJ28_00005498 [Nothophytophthora sp. Chile5]|nr:hypothetical protein BBJ28_00005498 [Nothophytophthora sp. Chile5]
MRPSGWLLAGMHGRQRGESLSARLRSEVQSSALWQTQRGLQSDGGFPCPREVKPLLFFYKYLQPLGDGGVSSSDANTSCGKSGAIGSQRKLRVNLPLTVICERSNGQETVLWLRTDAQGHVIREDTTPLWRRKLHSDLLASPSTSSVSGATETGGDRDPVLAVRSVAHWKSSNSSHSSGGSAVVLTHRTLDPVLAVPCDLPVCIQQFVHCRGSQASVYRIFWSGQERKCFAVNLTSGYACFSLKSTEAPEDAASSVSTVDGRTASAASSTVPTTSTMAAVNAAYEVAMAKAAQLARFYCVTVSPDARGCVRWPKLRGTPITEGVQATARLVEHVQMQLPALLFHAMTADFIKDTEGVWWLTRVVDFQATSLVEMPTDNSGCFTARDSAVQIAEFLRAKLGRSKRHRPAEVEASGPRDPTTNGVELVNASATHTCFLCGSVCEFSPTFQAELLVVLSEAKSDSSDDVGVASSALTEYRLTLTMALDTIYLLRQRGVILSVWEDAVQTVRKAQLRDVCEFPVCLLCYRIYHHQHRLQQMARELHTLLSPTPGGCRERTQGSEEAAAEDATSEMTAASAVCGLATSRQLATELRCRRQTPALVQTQLEAFQRERIPPALQWHGVSPETTPTWSTLTPVVGADVDPTATQLRLVLFFHELQDGGPDLNPTDFSLEYQLGQNVTRVQLEGSKRHTPNRWQLCEARIHYLCATLEAFSEFCTHKRLLIKLKAKSESSTSDGADNDGREDFEDEGQSNDGGSRDDEADEKDSIEPGTGQATGRKRSRPEFFGYAVLSLRPLITAAKWFGNSLQPECRTDYLLELHTASYAVLTLKVTVGLLVNPVPLAHVRDVIRDRIFLEERQPPSDATQSQQETQSLSAQSTDAHSMGKTLTCACVATKRIVSRLVDSAKAVCFPTGLLAAILRHASFMAASSSSSSASLESWSIPASFHFTRRHSVDQLLAEIKPGGLPGLALLGEMLFVLLEDRVVPIEVDVTALEPLLEPYWRQDSGWRAIPRSSSCCLPERRVVWNRAIRRWEAASGIVTTTEASLSLSLCHQSEAADGNAKPPPPLPTAALAKDIGRFRTKSLALVLCELFEQMEALDTGYIEIAELRSLAKNLPEGKQNAEEASTLEQQLDPELGTRERLSSEEIRTLAGLVERQRRLAVNMLLRSLMASTVFRQLACEALLSQREFFRAFHEEPRQSRGGFCLRHGPTRLYAIDSVCVLSVQSSSNLARFDGEVTRRKLSGGPLKAAALEEVVMSAAPIKQKKKMKQKQKPPRNLARRASATASLPTTASVSTLLRLELSEPKRTLAASASEGVIERAVRVEAKRKQVCLDGLVICM